MGKFYGLKGTQLNIAIAVVAGTDFALFGYGEYIQASLDDQWLTEDRSRCNGRSAHPGFLFEILP